MTAIDVSFFASVSNKTARSFVVLTFNGQSW